MGFFLNKQSHKKRGNQFKKLQLVKDSCIVIHIFKVCIIKKYSPVFRHGCYGDSSVRVRHALSALLHQ